MPRRLNGTRREAEAIWQCLKAWRRGGRRVAMLGGTMTLGGEAKVVDELGRWSCGGEAKAAHNVDGAQRQSKGGARVEARGRRHRGQKAMVGGGARVGEEERHITGWEKGISYGPVHDPMVLSPHMNIKYWKWKVGKLRSTRR